MYKDFYREVVKRTARLVADWQTFGFCHGVLNTGNMPSLLSFADSVWLERYQINVKIRQHEHFGSDDRLWTLWLYGRIWPGLHLQWLWQHWKVWPDLRPSFYPPVLTVFVNRYSYAKQPEICKWNCFKLAEAISPVLPKSFGLSILEEEWDTTYEEHYNQRMRNKLGLITKTLDDDKELFEVWSDYMYGFFCSNKSFQSPSSRPFKRLVLTSPTVSVD